MDCSPPGSSVYGDSPGKNTGVGCHSLLQGIFPFPKWQPTPVFLPGKFHGQRTPVGYSSWGHKESDTTEGLTTTATTWVQGWSAILPCARKDEKQAWAFTNSQWLPRFPTSATLASLTSFQSASCLHGVDVEVLLPRSASDSALFLCSPRCACCRDARQALGQWLWDLPSSFPMCNTDVVTSA